MKLAISSIAWTPDRNADVAALLQSRGIHGVELAPTQAFPQPLHATDADIERCRAFWESRGLQIVALQSLLFGRPDLELFGEPAIRQQAHDYLAVLIRMAGRLGAGAMVFGSPKNRRRDSLPLDAAREIAVPFFRSLGKIASENGTWFCIEPNPVEYGCDFVTTAEEGLALVREVHQPGFGLHLDAAGMTLSNDSASDVMCSAGTWWRHFHVSEPQLAPVTAASAISRHEEFAAAMTAARYDGWISIEMKTLPADSCLSGISAALDYCRQQYDTSLIGV